MIPVVQWLLTALLVAGLLFAVVSDLRHRLLPNWLTLSLGLAFLPAALAAGLGWRAVVLDHGLTALAVLAVGVLAFARGWVGGGDAKLLAAVSLWTGKSLLLPVLIYMALLGGVLAVTVLFLHRWYGTERAVPYGIAIATAMLLLLPRLDTAPAALAALFP